MKRIKPALVVAVALAFGLLPLPAAARDRWTAERATAWAKDTPWLVGCNYTPASAINQLEMWQADTFDPKQIDKELAWAEGLGFNSVRVFLHHLLWEQDRDGLLKRMDQFLTIADKHKIGVMFVLFDSCWDPEPKLGKQRAPQPGLHNSGWVQSPGLADLYNRARHPLLEGYVKGVVGRFKDDRRVQVWDVYNEPDNRNNGSYSAKEPADKVDRTLELLRNVFLWARAAEPAQPLTSGVWHGSWGDPKKLDPTERVQLDESDVISFHDYSALPKLQERVRNLQRYQRPLLCTEYMARPEGSRFDPCLAYLKEQKVAAYNWGFVSGRTQTIYPWGSWGKRLAKEPEVWFHDIFRADGTPFDAREVEFIRRVTGKVPAEKR